MKIVGGADIMDEFFLDAQVLSATISGLFNLTATIIAAVTASLIGKKFDNQSRLKADLNDAIRDIHFLLEVERAHCRLHNEASGSSKQKTVRSEVKSKGYVWSQRFTPGRVKNWYAVSNQITQKSPS